MSLRESSSADYFNRANVGAKKSMNDYMLRMTDKIEDPENNDHLLERWEQTVEGFTNLFSSYLDNRHNVVDWDRIRTPGPGTITPLDEVSVVEDLDIKKELASKLVVVKLNGGLGTSMGCVGPKSTIEVRQNQTFLDLIIKQLQYLNKTCDSEIPLILMNSFNTHEDTTTLLERYESMDISIIPFNQSKYPRVNADSLLPTASTPTDDNEHWYPPGHGDFYPSIYNSGVLDKLLAEGKEYIFLSNVDNLAATVNFDIMAHMVDRDADFIMEVTDKTRSDIKGGTLIEYEGKIKLLEVAQVPSKHMQEFKSIKKFKVFNTNNLWIKISAIKEVIESRALNEVEIIRNEKTVNGKKVIQLETAAGAAIQFFNNACAVNVPRSRFLPVKSTSDLFIVQSDIYKLHHGSLYMNELRPFPSVPIVKLGDRFKYVSDYQERIDGHPHILELDQLTISGDVRLGSDVTLAGTVIIVANDGNHIDIPSNSFLENKVVTGNLRVLDH
eukprot:TRINITY_DN4512_c0_g1_i1.p1 TRINITY_DN4512_c0_g1~~TRINITY_DN4512_c0_g1_i1.p1  ORF type:complete len:509 (-),score=109.02 TRINITY_DN4512_c0_g1_i1:33-1526(-)